MKKNYILVPFLILLCSIVNAQSSNLLNFDGMDDVVFITNNTTATFTLEALVRPLSNSPSGNSAYDGAGIMDSDVGGDANDFIFSILNNKLSFHDGSAEVNVNGNINLFDGNWHHVAVVREANVSISLYVDGVLDNQVSIGSATVLNSNPNIYIGSAYADQRFLNADIAEVRIWNTARTASEIDANKAGQLSLPQIGLASYYKFNQGIDSTDNTSQTTLSDELGSNNGTLMNFGLTGTSSNWKKDTTLSIDDFKEIFDAIKVYPNPSSDFIQIAALTQTANYKIYTIFGSEVKSGVADSNTPINILNLTRGLYLLKLNNGKSFKFAKE